MCSLWGHLGQQSRNARSDAEKAVTALLAHQLAPTEPDDARFKVDLIPGQRGNVGLAAAGLPQHLVVKLPLLVALPGDDPLMFLLGDRGELHLSDLRPDGIGHHGRKKPTEMQREIVEAAKVVLRRISRLLVLDDVQQVDGFGIDQLQRPQNDEGTAAKDPFLSVAGRGDARFDVMLHDRVPGARGKLGRGGGKKNFRHALVQGRLFEGLIFGGDQPFCGDALVGLETLFVSCFLIVAVVDAVGAADETVAIFHETYSGSLESLKNWGAWG